MIEEETKDIDDIDEYICRTEITKWIPAGKGKMKDVYTYTFVGNEIHYFKRIGNLPVTVIEGTKAVWIWICRSRSNRETSLL